MTAPRNNGDTPGGQHRIWVTSVADRLDHSVMLEAMEAALATGGRPMAVCGAHLLSAALCAPPQRQCPRCLHFELPAQRQVDRRRGGRHARPTAWQRFRDRTRHG
ncbi:MAG: hypothetical protein M3460_24225 [Actinomycetota bacterium]|nr:hypothetical protein [Actinomycetota bacterium]